METEYIDTSINPADYIEVWEVEDAEHGKQLVMAVDDLKCLPPADVRPVVRGKWVPEPDRHYHWHCSECGYTVGVVRMDCKYCPNCGADMREQEEDPFKGWSEELKETSRKLLASLHLEGGDAE